jgi:SAM-dependent methyltransferase
VNCKGIYREYAKLYDLFYEDKPYAEEAAFVDNKLRARKDSRRLLELGCGTGRHALEFVRQGWNVTGLDSSPVMIAAARARAAAAGKRLPGNVTFHCRDARSLPRSPKYDAICALFHVISYQVKTADLRAVLAGVRTALRPGGRFFFDFWHGPGVLSDRPEVRCRRFVSCGKRILRLAEPTLEIQSNSVSVKYTIMEEKSAGLFSAQEEIHVMRYFFVAELAGLLAEAGLKIIASGPGLKDGPLLDNTWFAWICACPADL